MDHGKKLLVWGGWCFKWGSDKGILWDWEYQMCECMNYLAEGQR